MRAMRALRDNRAVSIVATVTIGLIAIFVGVGGLASFWLYVATLFMCWVAIGAGMNVINGTCGMPALHGAATIAVGAYSYGILQEKLHLPWPVVAVLAVLVTTALVTAFMAPVVRLKDFYLSIASFIAVLLTQQVLGQWTSLTGGPFGLTLDTPVLQGATDVQSVYIICAVIAIIALCGYLLVGGSRLGTRMRAVRDSPRGAEASGIDVARTLLYGLALGNLLTACGGVALGLATTFLSPTQFGLATALETIAVVWAGGLDRPTSPIIGALLVGVLPNLSTGLAKYSTLLALGVLLVVLVAWPNGALAVTRRARDRAVLR